MAQRDDKFMNDEYDADEIQLLRSQAKKVKEKRFSFRKFVIASLIALIIGVGAYSLLGGQTNSIIAFAINGGNGDSANSSAPALKNQSAYYIALPTLTVNLINNNGQDAFLKVVPILEFDEKGLNEVVAERRPKIVDSFTSLMRNLRITDLKGSAGTQLLREELTKRANIALHPHRINNIRFEEILVQ